MRGLPRKKECGASGFKRVTEGCPCPGGQRGEGRDIRFATANLDFDPEMARPGRGVYAAQAIVDGLSYDAVVNIGKKPTFHQEYPVVAEAHLFDFSGVLYDRDISIVLVKKLRDERRFPNRDQLIQQIERDIHDAKSILKKQLYL